MQGDQNNQIVGEIQTPQSVTINTGQQAGMPFGANVAGFLKIAEAMQAQGVV